MNNHIKGKQLWKIGKLKKTCKIENNLNLHFFILYIYYIY